MIGNDREATFLFQGLSLFWFSDFKVFSGHGTEFYELSVDLKSVKIAQDHWTQGVATSKG